MPNIHSLIQTISQILTNAPQEPAKRNPCVKIGKKLNSFIPFSKWPPLKLCIVTNEETQIDFGGPIYNENNQEVYFHECIDRCSKFQQ